MIASRALYVWTPRGRGCSLISCYDPLGRRERRPPHAQRSVRLGRPRLRAPGRGHGPHGGSHRIDPHVGAQRRRPRDRARRRNGLLSGIDARRGERRADGEHRPSGPPRHAPALSRRAGGQPRDQRDDPQHRRQHDGARQRGHAVRHQGDSGARQAEQPSRHRHQRDGAVSRHQHGRTRGVAQRHDRRAGLSGLGGRRRHLLPDVVRQRVGDDRRGHGRDSPLASRAVPPDAASAAGGRGGRGGDRGRAVERREGGRRRPRARAGAFRDASLDCAGVLGRTAGPGRPRLSLRASVRSPHWTPSAG